MMESDFQLAYALNACDVNFDGSVSVVDAQLVIDQALGRAAAVSDLNGDGVVNVADGQIVIDAALGRGCLASSAPLTPAAF
jgi:hypothetical protein